MWVSVFFYGASVLAKSVAELAFSFADVLHVTFIALDHVKMNWRCGVGCVVVRW